MMWMWQCGAQGVRVSRGLPTSMFSIAPIHGSGSLCFRLFLSTHRGDFGLTTMNGNGGETQHCEDGDG